MQWLLKKLINNQWIRLSGIFIRNIKEFLQFSSKRSKGAGQNCEKEVRQTNKSRVKITCKS